MEKRQRFAAEFKREAIRLLQTSGKPVAVVAREQRGLALTPTLSRERERGKS